MEELVFLDRKHTDSTKWDTLKEKFGYDDLLSMWVADMDIQVPQCVQKDLQDYISFGAFGYYKTPESYYQAVINWEKNHHNYTIEKEWMRFSPGVVAAFNWIIHIKTNINDAIIVQTPVYYPFLDAVTNNGRKLITSPLINNQGIYTIDFNDFENKIIENNVKLFILCSPHNPAGRVWKKEELEKMIEICKKHDVFIISDEIHQDLTFYGNIHIPTLSLCDDYTNIISLMAASKTFNLAAMKHAVVVIKDKELQKQWDEYINQIRILNGNAMGYIATESAFSKGEDWYKQVLKLIENNATYVKEQLTSHYPHIIVSPLEGTYLTWIDLSYYVDNVQEFMLEKCHIAVDFGDWFGGEDYKGFIRINLATSFNNIETAISRILEALK